MVFKILNLGSTHASFYALAQNSKNLIEIKMFFNFFYFLLTSLDVKIKVGKIALTTAGGRNVDDQNVNRPKISERRNGLFS